MQLIQTITLGSAATTISFSSIPQDATDLVLIGGMRYVTGASSMSIAFSSLTLAPRRTLEGTGSAISSTTQAGSVFNRATNLSTYTANTFSNFEIYLTNYRASTLKPFYVQAVTENNATAADMALMAGVVESTTAVSTITFTCGTTNGIAQGSTISLYKITKA